MRAVMWDFDGVVADTEPLQLQAFAEVLLSCGVHAPLASLVRFIGQPESRIWNALCDQYGLEKNLSSLQSKRSRVYLKATQNLIPNWFVLPLLEFLENRSIPSWIVSSGSFRHIGVLLRRMQLLDKFEGVLCDGSPDEPGLKDKRERLEFVQREWGDSICLIEDRREYLQYAAENGWCAVAVRHSLNEVTAAEWPFVLDATTPLRGKAGD